MPFAALGATLEFLDVSMCVGFAGTLDALKHLRKLGELCLCGCVDLEGSLEPLRNLRGARQVERRGMLWPAGRGARLGDPAEAPEPEHLGHAA